MLSTLIPFSAITPSRSPNQGKMLCIFKLKCSRQSVRCLPTRQPALGNPSLRFSRRVILVLTVNTITPLFSSLSHSSVHRTLGTQFGAEGSPFPRKGQKGHEALSGESSSTGPSSGNSVCTVSAERCPPSESTEDAISWKLGATPWLPTP